jgi:hypothetical protein
VLKNTNKMIIKSRKYERQINSNFLSKKTIKFPTIKKCPRGKYEKTFNTNKFNDNYIVSNDDWLCPGFI